VTQGDAWLHFLLPVAIWHLLILSCCAQQCPRTWVATTGSVFPDDVDDLVE
jgi:hypothetical protein